MLSQNRVAQVVSLPSAQAALVKALMVKAQSFPTHGCSASCSLGVRRGFPQLPVGCPQDQLPVHLIPSPSSLCWNLSGSMSCAFWCAASQLLSSLTGKTKRLRKSTIPWVWRWGGQEHSQRLRRLSNRQMGPSAAGARSHPGSPGQPAPNVPAYTWPGDQTECVAVERLPGTPGCLCGGCSAKPVVRGNYASRWKAGGGG